MACGGNIPVIHQGDGQLEGVAAVIDKDLAAERYIAEGHFAPGSMPPSLRGVEPLRFWRERPAPV